MRFDERHDVGAQRHDAAEVRLRDEEVGKPL
jgi:hypothetical protein